MGRIFSEFGPLFLAFFAIILAYLSLHWSRKLYKERLDFEAKKFAAEEEERKKLATFRAQEYARFSQPAVDLATHIGRLLIEDPHWARKALEAAKILPYTDTLFGERSSHFREEKEELAKRFWPYLLARCRQIIDGGRRHVYLLIDSGTTLKPFFDLIGHSTAEAWQRQEQWLRFFHLATNNIPGLQDLMTSGRQVQSARYSKLAIEDCHLLPGVPMPVFGAVAGAETEAAITRLRDTAVGQDTPEPPVFLALVVGNWVRIRNTLPRCPVPMARGMEHKSVKQVFVDTADEIFVISPLGKIFVGHTNYEVNTALGFRQGASDPGRLAYDEVEILGNERPKKTKLVSTSRRRRRILYRHSVSVEDALIPSDRIGKPMLDEESFAHSPIDNLPHMLFSFDKLPKDWYSEFEVEFPHYQTRQNSAVLAMFRVEFPGGTEAEDER